MGPESEEERADAHDRSVTTIACLTARVERLAERRDRWVAVATEARIERDAAIARAEKAEAERDAARRILLAMAEGCDRTVPGETHSRAALRTLEWVDRALGLDGGGWDETAAALRKLCGVSDG